MSRPSRRGRRRLVAIAASLTVAAAGCASSPPGVGAPAPATSLTSPPAQPAGVLPDRSRTPGAVASTDLAVVCASGYSDSVRPPASYTSALKRRQLAAGYPGTAGLSPADVEEDHLVMLALGGDPRSEANLWPEPRHVTTADGAEGDAAAKDSYESWLYDQVCHGHTIALVDAQRALATDWYAAWTAAARPRGTTGGD